MPIISCYVDDKDHASLVTAAAEAGRTVEDLAESAISEAACGWRRDNPSPSPDPVLPFDEFQASAAGPTDHD